MSLINQMLRDLESRRVAPVSTANVASLALAAERAGTPVAPPSPRGQGWLIAGLLLVTGLLALMLIVQNKEDSGPGSEDSVAVSPPPVTEAQPQAPEPPPSTPSTKNSVLSTQHSALSPQHSALSTEHSALSTQHSVLSPQSSVLTPESPPPLPARVKAVRLRSLDGVTRIFVDLDRRAVHHATLDGERLTLSLSGVTEGLPRLPSLSGTPLADLDSRFEAGELRLEFRFDAPQRLRGSELRETAGGVRLIVTLAARQPVLADVPATASPVSKRVRPLDDAQRAAQALRRGVGLLGQGRQAEAELALREALRLDPRLVRAREALAAMYLNGGRVTEARELLAEGLRLMPRASGLAQLYARLLVERGELPAALQALVRARPPLAGNADYHALLAALYQRAGRHEAAAWTYRELLAKDAGKAPWWLGLAISLEALGRPAEALDAYVKAHQLGAGLEAAVLDYAAARIRALAPGVAAARRAAGQGGE